jgi:signal transduction histidine kinase
MRLNLDMNILRHMTDGVVVLDRYAQIVAFNKIAEP